MTPTKDPSDGDRASPIYSTGYKTRPGGGAALEALLLGSVRPICTIALHLNLARVDVFTKLSIVFVNLRCVSFIPFLDSVAQASLEDVYSAQSRSVSANIALAD